jgi:hypothetical protein
MSVRTMERAAQVLQVLACWTAFAMVWWASIFAYRSLESQGADLPLPALALFAVARDGWPLLVPALYTFAVLWLGRRGSANAAWIGAAVLSVALFLLTFAILGFASPHATLCKNV